MSREKSAPDSIFAINGANGYAMEYKSAFDNLPQEPEEDEAGNPILRKVVTCLDDPISVCLDFCGCTNGDGVHNRCSPSVERCGHHLSIACVAIIAGATFIVVSATLVLVFFL